MSLYQIYFFICAKYHIFTFTSFWKCIKIKIAYNVCDVKTQNSNYKKTKFNTVTWLLPMTDWSVIVICAIQTWSPILCLCWGSRVETSTTLYVRAVVLKLFLKNYATLSTQNNNFLNGSRSPWKIIINKHKTTHWFFMVSMWRVPFPITTK